MGNINEKCTKPNPKKSHSADHSNLNKAPAPSFISFTNAGPSAKLTITAIEASNRQRTVVARCLLPKSAVAEPIATKIISGQLSEKARDSLFTRNSSAKATEAKSNNNRGVVVFRGISIMVSPISRQTSMAPADASQ